MIVPFDACSLHHPVVPPPDTARACTGEYLMGRVTLVECRSCTQERTVQTTPADAMQATIVPLTTTRMSAAVLDVDLRAFCKQDAALRRGLSPGQAVKQYKFAGSDGLNVQAFRTLLSAYVFSEATALRVLRGWVLQCVTCGTRPSRGFTDCNLKAMRLHVASLRETPIKVPGGVVAQRDTTYEVERASASSAADARAASKHGKVTCGGLDWVAANSGVGRKLPLATTGASVSVCGHLHAMTVLPMTRGEVMTLPIYHLLYNALKYCTLLGQDVWCLLLAHMRAQSAADPAFADAVGAAVTGQPSCSVRIVTRPGHGPVIVSVQESESAQLRVLASVFGGSSGTPPSESPPPDGAPSLASRAVRSDACDLPSELPVPPAATMLPPAPAGWDGMLPMEREIWRSRPEGVVLHLTGFIPVLHAMRHECEHVHGAFGTQGSGHRGEAAEIFFAAFSAFAPRVTSMSETGWRMAVETMLAWWNHFRNVGAAQRAVNDVVRILHSANKAQVVMHDAAADFANANWLQRIPGADDIAVLARARQRREEARLGYVKVSRPAQDVDIDATAASEQAIDDSSRSGVSAAVMNQAQAVRLAAEYIKVSEDRDALQSVVRVADTLGTNDSGVDAEGVSTSDSAAWARFVMALRLNPRAQTVVNRPAAAKRHEVNIADMETARQRLELLNARLAALETKLTSQHHDTDALVTLFMKRLRGLADDAARLRPPQGVAPHVGM